MCRSIDPHKRKKKKRKEERTDGTTMDMDESEKNQKIFSCTPRNVLLKGVFGTTTTTTSTTLNQNVERF